MYKDQASDRISCEMSRASQAGPASAFAGPYETKSQSSKVEPQDEKDRLKLVLDLNNRLVSNLELQGLLRAISANVRRVMQLTVDVVVAIVGFCVDSWFLMRGVA